MFKLLRVLFFFSGGLLLSCQTYTNRNSLYFLNQGSKPLSEIAFYNMQLGLAYLAQGNRPKAKQKLIKALNLTPNSAPVCSALAYYYEEVEELEKAQDYYQKALSLAKKYNREGQGPELNNYGVFLCRRGKYYESEKYFLEAIKDKKYLNTAGAYENAGLCLAAVREHKRAKYYLKKALKQDPEKKHALYELINIELKQNKLDRALKYIKENEKLILADPYLLNLASKYRAN